MRKRRDPLAATYDKATDTDRLRAEPRAVGAAWLLIALLLLAAAGPRIFGAVPCEAAQMARAARSGIHVLAAHLPHVDIGTAGARRS